jgi:ATP-binding cassette, subfamily F, member 3
MLTVTDLLLHFGDRPMFDGVSFFIGSDDRIGLVGRNGAGKSTLLKVIAGKQPYDGGSIGKPRDLTLGYLPQEMTHDLTLSPRQVAEKAFQEAQDLRKGLERIEQDLANTTDADALMDLATMLAHAHERLNALGAADHEGDIEAVLKGLGFVGADLDRPLAELSGGWRMRAELARILLMRPDLLLLDEPTNHLDLPAIQWLEDLLRTYPAALVLISHDKTFLDRLTTRTIEVSGGKLIDRKVSWSKYVELRKFEKEQTAQAAKEQQRYIEHTQELINKFRAKKNKAAFAQSLITKLDKLDRIELEDDDLRKMLVRFPPAPASGKIVCEVKAVHKAYGERVIFQNADLIIAKGEHLALVGANGTGKSTLVRMIGGAEPFEGEIKLGHNVVLGYYAQDATDRLPANQSVMETAEQAASEENRRRVRAMLGAFLFSGDDVDKPVRVLSGGERARLALCCMLLRPLNFLLLDEPTHHLDIQSKDVLKEALKGYDGTFLLVSHDRDFLHGLTTRLLELDDHRVRDQHMDILELIEKRKALQASDMGASNKPAAMSNATTAVKPDQRMRREREKERRRLQSAVQRAEEQLADLEKLEKEAHTAVMRGGQSAEQVAQGYAKLEELARLTARRMQEWEEASAKLESLGVEELR